jgi:hypothetical protein
MAKVVTLKKGNCLIYSLCFKWANPKAKIIVKWNKKRKVPSFFAKLDDCTYVYKPANNDKKFKLIFEGKVIVMKNKFGGDKK